MLDCEPLPLDPQHVKKWLLAEYSAFMTYISGSASVWYLLHIFYICLLLWVKNLGHELSTICTLCISSKSSGNQKWPQESQELLSPADYFTTIIILNHQSTTLNGWNLRGILELTYAICFKTQLHSAHQALRLPSGEPSHSPATAGFEDAKMSDPKWPLGK